MRRRDLIAAFGLGAVVTSVPRAFAQSRPERQRHIAVLMPYPEDDLEGRARLDAFVTALAEIGWHEGQNLRLEQKWAGGAADRISALARDIVSSQPEVILAVTTPAAVACAKLTTAIPIIFASVTDPIGIGLTANFASSGRNITGFTNFEFSIGGKWLDIIQALAPRVKRAAVLFSPKTAPYYPGFIESVEKAGKARSLDTLALPATDETELRVAIEGVGPSRNTALLVIPDVFTTTNRVSITRLAIAQRIPSIYPFRFFAEAGGLVSYGFDQLQPYGRAATYADRILRGEDPASLPIQYPTRFEMVINGRTAKQIGIEVPPSLLASADEVIE